MVYSIYMREIKGDTKMAVNLTAGEIRAQRRAESNNPINRNKNICTSAVCSALGVINEVRYLQTSEDVVRATRKGWQVRSRKSQLRKGASVGQARAVAKKLTETESGSVRGYIVFVPGHVLLLDKSGQTTIDTASRKQDKRKVIGFYKVTSYAGV